MASYKTSLSGGKCGRSLMKLSKSLSYILRHGAEKEGFSTSSEGFIDVDAILCHRQFKIYSEDDIRQVVESNEKQRFALRRHPVSHKLQIRANQGHSFEISDLELTPITKAEDAPVVVHGTYLSAWNDFISKEGLSRMKRTHIHFAAGVPGDDKVISGARSSVEVLIFVDISKALANGFVFYRSANNVILCPGNENGMLPVKYFEKVIQCKPKNQVLFESVPYHILAKASYNNDALGH